MRNIYKILMLALVIGATSCEDYLDKPAPTDGVSGLTVFASTEGVRAYLNGINKNIKDYGTTTDMDGAHSISVRNEARGIDAVFTDLYGWYGSAYEYRDVGRNQDSNAAVNIWTYLYDIIAQTNLLINGVETGSLSDQESAGFIAEAKAIRAWCYFNLVRQYAHNNPDDTSVPLYTDVIDGSALDGGSRETVRVIYDQIIGDLEDAKTDIPSTSSNKSSITTNIVNGLLARVYSTIGVWDNSAWAKAEAAAQAARTGFPLSANEYSDEFTSVGATEWIWGYEFTAEDNGGWTNLASWWDLDWSDGKDGYSNFNWSVEFVDMFSTTDVRNLFTRDITFVFDNPEGDLMYGTRKFQFLADFSDDYVMMRSAEMYLIEAEALAEQGSDAAAATLLFELQSNRDVNAVASGNIGTALMDEILVERRKELYGELGVSFLDAKRKNIPLVRGASHNPVFRFTIQPGDDLLILDIPMAEINANQNISGK
jgi:hypothetical protein